jgi:hypothetical protein
MPAMFLSGIMFLTMFIPIFQNSGIKQQHCIWVVPVFRHKRSDCWLAALMIYRGETIRSGLITDYQA